MKRALVATLLALGLLVAVPATAEARDTNWPCHGC